MKNRLSVAVLTALLTVGVTVTLVVKPAYSAEPSKPTEKAQAPKKSKPRTDRKSRIAEGATKASGAEIVRKSTACFGTAPKIEKIDPDEVKAGDKVTITGRDFGVPGCLSSVSFGPGNPAKFEQKNESQVTATVPSLKRKGIVLLTLTTASGEDSKPVFIK
jgi:hypothetical protein